MLRFFILCVLVLIFVVLFGNTDRTDARQLRGTCANGMCSLQETATPPATCKCGLSCACADEAMVALYGELPAPKVEKAVTKQTATFQQTSYSAAPDRKGKRLVGAPFRLLKKIRGR